MSKIENNFTDVLDQLDKSIFKLMFLESALKSLVDTGNIGEVGVKEGCSYIIQELISDFREVAKQVEQFSHTNTN